MLSIADFKLKEGGKMVAKHFEGAGLSECLFARHWAWHLEDPEILLNQG